MGTDEQALDDDGWGAAFVGKIFRAYLVLQYECASNHAVRPE
jgi:hypothetical protein